LEIFLTDGHKFNGTNLFLGNLLEDKILFCNNYGEDDSKYEILKDSNQIYSVANGKISENWEKEKLGKRLIQGIFDRFGE
jgi:uncharacterized protein with NRDE domain